MLILLARRLAVSIVLVMFVSLVTFLLIGLSPSDVAYTLLGARATPDQIAAVRAELGLDQPLIVQYGAWAWDALRGDLGESLITHQSVIGVVGERIEPTVSVLLLTVALTGAAGTVLGVSSAVRGGVLARIVDAVGLIGVAVPGFIVGLLLIVVFAVRLRAVPAGGYVGLGTDPSLWLRALVLPVVALAVGSIGLVAKQVRSSMSDALEGEFVRTLVANGFRRRSVIYRHALRSAAVPVLAVMGVTLVGMLGGSVLIEQVFGIPGLGGLAVSATLQKDLPVVQGVSVIYALIVVVVNLALDLVFALVNPKVRIT